MPVHRFVVMCICLVHDARHLSDHLLHVLPVTVKVLLLSSRSDKTGWRGCECYLLCSDATHMPVPPVFNVYLLQDVMLCVLLLQFPAPMVSFQL